MTGAVEANNLLIVYPSAEPDHIEVFLIRHGRLLAQRRVGQEEELIRDELRALVGEAAALGAPPSRVGRAEVDQINIIARWISHHSEDDERAFFRLPHELDDAAMVEAFIAQVTDTVLASLLTGNMDGADDDGEDEVNANIAEDIAPVAKDD